MNDYILKNQSESAAHNETVWAFDRGKGALGKGVRRDNEFLHQASQLIPAALVETKTAALVAHTRLMQTLRHADHRHL
jgi:hypothetical protein